MNTERDFQEFGKIKRADVYKGKDLAAHLTRTDEGVRFEYTAEYLASDLPPIAHSLPKSSAPQTINSGGVPSFFAGLLPEGRRLNVLRRAIKTSADDELSMLLAVGRDVIGDARIVPTGDLPNPIKPLVEVTKTFEEINFTDLVADFAEIDKVGLPGVQEKVSATRIWVPASREGSQFILKLGSSEHPFVIENEYYFLGIARKSLKNVVRAEIVHDFDGESGLLVTRFDRILDAIGNPISIAVEDACQVLNRWPADKYHISSEAIVIGLSKVCASPKLAARELYRQFCFAWFTGNGDLHAKNISIISTQDGEWKISPAYDLPSTLPYGDTSLALTIGGKKIGHSRRSLVEFGMSVGLSEKLATKVMDEILDSTAHVIEDLLGGSLPFDQQKISDSIAELRHRRRTGFST